MTAGFYTSTGRYTLTHYVAKSRAFTSGETTYYAYVCAELGDVLFGNVWDTENGHWVAENVTAEGVSYTAVGGESFYASATSQTGAGTITAATFATLLSSASGAGTIALSAGTLYGNRYAVVGASVTYLATPSSGFVTKRIDAVSGSSVIATSTTSTLTFTVTGDTTTTAYFEVASYTLHRTVASGGAMSIYRTASGASIETNITNDFVNDRYTVGVGDVIRVRCIANGTHQLAYFRIDNERRYPTTTSATQDFIFTIVERTSDPLYDFQAVFTTKATYVAYLTTVNGNLGTVAVTHSSGTTVPVSGGAFTTTYGETYTLTATVTTPTTNAFDGWYDANGNRLADAEVLTYTFTQTDVQRSFVGKFMARTTVDVAYYTGTSATTYGTADAAYQHGCRLAAVTPTTVETKYLSGNWTFTPTVAAGSGWAFVSLYVEDLDLTGQTAVYTELNEHGKIVVNIAFNARVIAIFRDTATPVTPGDVDQGHANKATGENARGIWTWEGGATAKTAVWRSKRFVGNIPVNWSAACAYADGYPITMRIDGFQSPDTTDAKSVSLVAKSQSGYRIPMRRAEKYTEIEVTSAHTVTHLSVATSMAGLAGGAA